MNFGVIDYFKPVLDSFLRKIVITKTKTEKEESANLTQRLSKMLTWSS